MAAPTNTYTSTAAVGNREDLADVIYRISPTETPLLSLAERVSADNTLHEWQTQALAAPADNAQAEGDDATADAAVPTVRLGNRTQIARKTARVSGTQQEVNTAGRKKELAYQVSLKALEMKRDMELGLTQNNVSATAPRRSRGMVGWMDAANVDAGAGYVAPNYVTNVAQTDGTQRAFTEAQLKNVAQKIYTSGGNPNTLMLGPAQKQTFSTFLGNSTRFDEGEDKKVVAATDIYVTDFGALKAIPNRIQRTRDAFVIENEKVAVAYLRPIQKTPLAKTGDSDAVMILAEYCLENRAPLAHGGVLDLL
ncbi:DUF5309 domain-containing protein [Variovorax sp. NFACC27]|uniref:DUF5309 domain-containing protein n=1 Tax=unclassified Variovorax TaxID=663243 RepID=UPI00089668A3|nr:hypothetical protein SAMN03159371_00137 [Variovorax sp. NFACC28]SEF71818.1 hypothetical protein SAMN03159365_00681 [Variovorax sp. NFACC29]SFB76979.1 hypothetical protein SAMN03159379_00680 [Variovorax sp. NFACC26]SFG76601.1 hypothetical protein SAMN03159447_04803 [Variovorax sp. NFACC27]